MQAWIVAGAWAGVAVFAMIVLGFLSYEVSWKARRVSADRAKLTGLLQQLSAVVAPINRPVGRPVTRPGTHRQEER